MEHFDSDSIDALKEIFNISYGTAIGLLMNSAGGYAELEVPDISILPIDRIQDCIDNLPLSLDTDIVVNQKYQGAFSGECLLLIERAAAKDLGALMLDEDSDSISAEDTLSCALELSNILTTASIGKLAELLSEHMAFSAPVVLDAKIHNFIINYKANNIKRFFVIKTWLKTDEKKIAGYLFLFIKEESFGFMRDSIDRFVNDYE
jgi:chemotaxis protein CheY-P-specific phosphatase CheC